MNELVFKNEYGYLVTDTLKIAEIFGKRHDNVMIGVRKQVDKLIEAGEKDFTDLNFEVSDYIDSTGRNLMKYNMTENGFTLIAMSYNTIEAMKFKVMFINEFKRMKEHIISLENKPKSRLELAKENVMLIEEIEAMESRNKQLTNVLGTYQKHGSAITVRDFTKIVFQENNIVIKEREMWKLLDEKYVDGKRLPYAKYKKYFEVYQCVKNGAVRTTTKLSPKGILYFTNKLLEMR